MLLQFSEAHGPSQLDSIDLFIIMIGYVPMVQVVKRFSFVQTSLGKSKSFLLVVTSIFFLAMIALALNFEYEFLLWISATVSSLAQGVLVYWEFRLTAS